MRPPASAAADPSQGRPDAESSARFDLLRLPAVGPFLCWRPARLVLQTPLLLLAIVMVGHAFFGPELAPDGSDHPFVKQVDATPPGIGPWGPALFLAPIVLFGALFVLALRKCRQAAKRSRPQAVRVGGDGKPCLPPTGSPDEKDRPER